MDCVYEKPIFVQRHFFAQKTWSCYQQTLEKQWFLNSGTPVTPFCSLPSTNETWQLTPLPIFGSPPFVLMAVSGKALAAGSGRIQNPRLAPCGSLITSINKSGGDPKI